MDGYWVFWKVIVRDLINGEILTITVHTTKKSKLDGIAEAILVCKTTLNRIVDVIDIDISLSKKGE